MKSLLLLLFSLSCSLSAYAQLTGRFYLDKATFAPNESIEIHFEILNSSRDTKETEITGIPKMPFCAGYLVKPIKVPQNASTDSPAANTCVLNGQFHFHSIPAGQKYTVSIPLNNYFKALVSGDYSFVAKHLVPPSVETTLIFHVAPSSAR